MVFIGVCVRENDYSFDPASEWQMDFRVLWHSSCVCVCVHCTVESINLLSNGHINQSWFVVSSMRSKLTLLLNCQGSEGGHIYSFTVLYSLLCHESCDFYFYFISLLLCLNCSETLLVLN